MKKAILAASLLLVGGLAFGPSAKANYVLDLTQVGSNVVVNGSGTIDLTGLTYVATSGPSVSFLDPSYGTVTTGSAGATPEDFTGFTGPTTFGTGGYTKASSGSGDYVGIDGKAVDSLPPLLAVPDGYVSGGSLSSSAIFDNETLASLGVTPGTYVWTWGGAPDGSFTVIASVSSVPEPGSLALFGTALVLAIGGSRRRRA
jgi:hypothetical protein